MTTLTTTTSVSDELSDLIGDGLNGYNREKAGPPDERMLWIVARDEDGSVAGGLKGRSEFAWLFVDWLWIRAERRGQGIGGRLLAGAEAEARARGCAGIYLGSFTFQAPDFYKRAGYSEFGRIDGFPPGHALVFLMKRL
ncbi:MAG TPA: GNAT family N-acetyltransferase [Rhizobiales bacterium]|nr:GNAT family N-acetyltransferase [Hyphomicrobiales bacterium]